MPGHFARTGSVRVHLVRAGPVPVHFAPAGPLLGDVARARSLPAHFARDGRVGAFSWAGWSGILYNLYWGILNGLYDLCPCMFLGRPGLVLLKQGFG